MSWVSSSTSSWLNCTFFLGSDLGFWCSSLGSLLRPESGVVVLVLLTLEGLCCTEVEQLFTLDGVCSTEVEQLITADDACD